MSKCGTRNESTMPRVDPRQMRTKPMLLSGLSLLERRAFLGGSLATLSSLIPGCADDPSGAPDADGGAGSGGTSGADAAAEAGLDAGTDAALCSDPFAGGTLLQQVPFDGEGNLPLDTPTGQGWDGRLYTDLSKLDPGALIIENDRFYIRTRYPDQIDPNAPWTVRVRGLVETEFELSMADLTALEQPQGAHVLECSGNSKGGHFGLLSAAEWTGASIKDVLGLIGVHSSATRVLISGFDGHSVPSVGGHSKPGASWVFTFQQLEAAGAFLALKMNGVPLPEDHGKPVRLYVPGWYGCTCIKWVDEIRLVDESEPATAQMQEYASRTHQNGVPTLSKDYLPATMDQAAMPVRVEKWSVGGKIRYRIVGILWGGSAPTDKLEIRFAGGAFEPVNVCPPPTQNQTWTLWTHSFAPTTPGKYSMDLRVAGAAVPQKRLDLGWYQRAVVIDAV